MNDEGHIYISRELLRQQLTRSDKSLAKWVKALLEQGHDGERIETAEQAEKIISQGGRHGRQVPTD